MTLDAARAGDADAFADLVAPYRHELRVHCYRMLGSADDADDAVQEALLAAWRGLGGFEERSSLRTWLYRIATNAALRIARKSTPRLLSWDHGPARGPDDDLGEPQPGPWLEPLPTPAEAFELRERVGLAFVAALQHLPPNQRAVLLLREVLDLSAAEVGELLETSVASVNSALQRARQTVAERAPEPGRAGVGDQAVLERFVDAFERRDLDALVALLAAEVRFTMPPLPAWFDGREDVSGFFGRRVFATRWKATPLVVNGQPAMACHAERDGAFRLSAVNVLTVEEGRITWIASFLDPATLAGLGLPEVR